MKSAAKRRKNKGTPSKPNCRCEPDGFGETNRILFHPRFSLMAREDYLQDTSRSFPVKTGVQEKAPPAYILFIPVYIISL